MQIYMKILITTLTVMAVPVAAQDQIVGKVAESSVGEIGKRQDDSSKIGNVAPMARIQSRITNRVQSRIRSRIDRYYDPKANATSPFEIAGDQILKSGQSVRR